MKNILLALSFVSVTAGAVDVTSMNDGDINAAFQFFKNVSNDETLNLNFKVTLTDADLIIEEEYKKNCTEFINRPVTDVTETVHYWFNKLEELEKFEVDAKKQALSSLPKEHLEIMSGGYSSSVQVLTDESISRDYPDQWVTDQKVMCDNSLNGGL